MNAGGSALNTTLVAVLATNENQKQKQQLNKSKENIKNIVTQEQSNIIKEETTPLLDENINSINNFTTEINTKNKCCSSCTIL